MFCITNITARTDSHLIRVDHTHQNVNKGIYKDVNLKIKVYFFFKSTGQLGLVPRCVGTFGRFDIGQEATLSNEL